MSSKTHSPDLRVAHIIENTSVDGPGLRVAIFVQGCFRKCEGCQSPQLHGRMGGRGMSPRNVAAILVNTKLPITISGGEPFDQTVALRDLLVEIRELAPARHIIVYTGYTWEELTTNLLPITQEVLSMINVLIDGPYIREMDGEAMQYMGSANQRAIYVPASLAPHQPMEATKPLVLDWQQPEIIVTGTGRVLGTKPVMAMLGSLGQPSPARRCGQIS